MDAWESLLINVLEKFLSGTWDGAFKKSKYIELLGSWLLTLF